MKHNRRQIASSNGGLMVDHRHEKDAESGLVRNGSVLDARNAMPRQLPSKATTVCWGLGAFVAYKVFEGYVGGK